MHQVEPLEELVSQEERQAQAEAELAALPNSKMLQTHATSSSLQTETQIHHQQPAVAVHPVEPAAQVVQEVEVVSEILLFLTAQEAEPAGQVAQDDQVVQEGQVLTST